MQILQIGGGNMGGALLDRWSDKLDWSFTLVDPGTPNVPADVTHVSTLSELERASFDGVIIAVKPQILDDAISGIERCLSRAAFVVSIVAGVPTSRLEGIIGPRPIIRAMPNMPVSIGRGMTGLYGNSLVKPSLRWTIDGLFKPTGEVQWVEEEDTIDRFTAIAGSGPGYVFELLRGYTAAAQALGFSEEDSERLAQQTVRGAVELAIQSSSSAEELRDAVTSKRGTTEAGLNVMRGELGFESLLREGTEAAYQRAIELRA